MIKTTANGQFQVVIESEGQEFDIGDPVSNYSQAEKTLLNALRAFGRA